MEMASMEHHLTARCIKRKDHSRGIQELIMAKRSRKKLMTLEVQVMFEPNRFEERTLHKAYGCLLPISRRRLQAAERTQEVPAEMWDQTTERKTL
jgi:hypothetical protein